MQKNNMNLNETIENSANWLNSCNELVDNTAFEATDRNRVSCALLHLSMEHHGSIHLLTTKKHYGSAFALLRPQFESFIRGVWFHKPASDEQLNSYINNNEPPRINALINDIQENPGYNEGTLKEAKNKVWGTMCDYTHGGYFQVAYRNSETEIANDYQEEDIIGLLTTASNIAYLSVAALASLTNNENIAFKAVEFHKEIFGSKHA